MGITRDNLTVIIVTLKSEKIIHNCLDSIGPDIKKIIIENSNNQKFTESLKKKYKNIECFTTGKNLGMGTGNNFGIKKSTTKYAMILNPDTILKEKCIDEIINNSKDINFTILSPLNEDKRYPNYKIFNQKKINDNLFEVDRVDGYAMILDISKFDNNFFDEKIFMYLENDDLCLRVKKKKEKIYVCSNSLISHLGAKTVDEIYRDEIEFSRNWHWSWSKFYFRKKHYGILNSIFFNFLPFLKSILKILYYFLIRNKFKKKIYLCRASGFFNSAINKSSWFRPRLD
tara:strand:+ start:263 stop:1120 length:858 start_codon:yes stop_codon:yes gene_type:complete